LPNLLPLWLLRRAYHNLLSNSSWLHRSLHLSWTLDTRRKGLHLEAVDTRRKGLHLEAVCVRAPACKSHIQLAKTGIIFGSPQCELVIKFSHSWTRTLTHPSLLPRVRCLGRRKKIPFIEQGRRDGKYYRSQKYKHNRHSCPDFTITVELHPANKNKRCKVLLQIFSDCLCIYIFLSILSFKI
jgi:hypothetical protein